MGDDWKAAAKQHCADRRAEPQRPIEIPEWGVTLYVGPSLLVRLATELAQVVSEGKRAEAIAMTLIRRLKNEDGSPVWSRFELEELLTDYDPEVLMRVVNEIDGDDGDLEAEKKE